MDLKFQISCCRMKLIRLCRIHNLFTFLVRISKSQKKDVTKEFFIFYKVMHVHSPVCFHETKSELVKLEVLNHNFQTF